MIRTSKGYAFHFSEIWGAAPCHICQAEDYVTLITQEEFDSLTSMTAADACSEIVRRELGKPVCYKHIGDGVEPGFYEDFRKPAK